MLPWLAFIPVGGADLSTEEFVRDKILAGDWWEISGSIPAVTNEIVFIPASGKTAFPWSGKIVVNDNTNTSHVIADLKVNGVTKSKTHVGVEERFQQGGTTNGFGGRGYGNYGDGKFAALGKSLVGDGIKDITIENVVDNGSVFAEMQGWIQNT